VSERAQSSLPGGELTLCEKGAVTSYHDADCVSLVAGAATPTSPAADERRGLAARYQ